MLKLFVLVAIFFAAVSAEADPKPAAQHIAPYNYHNVHPHNFGAFHQLDAYKHHPYGYDASKFAYNHGAYPYGHHNAYNYGAYAYPHHDGYSHPYGVHPYQAAGYQYPYSGLYNKAHVIPKH